LTALSEESPFLRASTIIMPTRSTIWEIFSVWSDGTWSLIFSGLDRTSLTSVGESPILAPMLPRNFCSPSSKRPSANAIRTRFLK